MAPEGSAADPLTGIIEALAKLSPEDRSRLAEMLGSGATDAVE